MSQKNRIATPALSNVYSNMMTSPSSSPRSPGSANPFPERVNRNNTPYMELRDISGGATMSMPSLAAEHQQLDERIAEAIAAESVTSSEGRQRLELLQAAVLVDDAKYNRTEQHGMSRNELQVYNIVFGNYFRWFYNVVVTVNLSLILFEIPPVIDVPVWATQMVELITIILFLVRLYLYSLCNAMKPWVLLKDKKHLGVLVVCGLNVIDMIIHAATGLPRLTRWLRVVFIICQSKHVRHALRDIRFTIADIVSVIALLIIFVSFYAVFCLVLFQDDPRFSTYLQSFLSLYVLRTTANFPDVMMRVYTKNRLNALVFVVFLVIATYLLTSFILAVIYNKYRYYVKTDEIKARSRRREKFDRAYALLAVLSEEEGNRVTKDTFDEFMKVFRPSYGTHKVDLIWATLCNDTNAKSVSIGAWTNDFIDILNMHIEGRLDKEDVCQCSDKTPTGQAVMALVESPYFNHTIDVLIVLNNILIALDISLTDETTGRAVTITEIVFATIFLFELILRLAAVGPREYFKKRFNVLDVVLLAVTFVDLAMALTPTNELPGIFSYALLFRTFRLWASINRFERFSVILRTIFQLLPALVTYSIVQFCLFYIYACFGMVAFSGLIYEGNPNLEGTDFARLNYFANSFNNFFESFITLFELMVVNQWHVLAMGYVAVTSQWAWLFFITFNILATLVILNIVVAFILEAFITQWHLNTSDGKDALAARIEDLSQLPQFRLDSGEEESDRRTVWTVTPKQNYSYFLAKILNDDIMAEEEEMEIFQL